MRTPQILFEILAQFVLESPHKREQVRIEDQTMRRNLIRKLVVASCICFFRAALLAQGTNRVAYTVLDGSILVDDCPICGRPTIEEPLRGTFDLVSRQITPPYSRYDVTNIDFVAGAGTGLERHITGSGAYVRFEEFAILQDMTLAVQIKDAYTNRTAYFTNESRSVSKSFPLIDISLDQTNPIPSQRFAIRLFAAPVREIWFSTTRSLNSTNRPPPTNQISAGDLISNHGRIVKRNQELARNLGVMPPVADLGLDAVQIVKRGEILFSLPQNVFSETLGLIQHGDLLSSRGAIVRSNQQLLAAFHPVTTNDAGLDAFRFQPTGEILFSIQSNVLTASGTKLSRGDILSDQGYTFAAHQRLMANFHPTVTNNDFGLDAFQILPSGEIWFSVEEGFTDIQIGAVKAGDLLSSFGFRVLKNEDLVAAFAPSDPSIDYGFDALFVITDTEPVRLAPRFVQLAATNGALHLKWDGDGAVFQIERATDPSGPWTTCSPLLPDLSWDRACTEPSAFFRLRQW